MKKDKKEAVFAKDSIINVLSGKGIEGRDTKTANTWVRSAYDYDLLDTIYSEHWLARNCVDVPANEAAAKWREIRTPSMTPEQKTTFEKFEKSQKVKEKFREASRLARKYGGAAVYLAVEGVDITKELTVDQVHQGAKINLIVFSRNDLTPNTSNLETDEMSPNYNRPKSVTIRKSMRDAHVSRFLVFNGPGIADTSQSTLQDRFWGRSVLDSSLISAIERIDSAMDSLGTSLEQATVDILKIPGLFLKLADPEATRLLRARVAEGAMTRSIYRISMVDKDEDFVRAEATGTLSAGAQVLQTLLQIPSGATGIPVTKLLGISPGGLNATGESDSSNYFSLLGAIRSESFETNLEILDPILCQILFGSIFADWGMTWPPFWESDKVQESTIVSQRLQNIINLVQARLLPEKVALRQVFEDGTFSALTEQDVSEFEDFVDSEIDDLPIETPKNTEESVEKVEENAVEN